MHASEPLPARLIGALFVERGLVSESQIRVALEIQRETGHQLGQVLVERFGVSRKELASVVADQWAKLGGSSGPEDTASWRRLGEIFVERGFVTEEELDHALTRQRQTGERLGEALVAQGVISKFELAGALAEQMATLEGLTEPDAPADPPEATVHHLPTRMPDPAEIPFGAVFEVEPTEEQGPSDDDEEHVGGDVEIAGGAEDVASETAGLTVATEDLGEDVGEVHVGLEAADAAEVDPVVDAADATLGPIEAIAIDDVGHVSLVGAATEPIEP
jgi:hypothetical protein